MIELIGIAAQKQMGKTSLTDIIGKVLKEKQYDVQKVAFADEIKNSFCQLFNVDLNFIEEWKEKPEPPPGWDMTVRKALQFIGDGFRGIKPTVWVDQSIRTIGNNKWWRKVHVFSDIRYGNELSATKLAGGEVILLYRPGYLNDVNHPSESQIRTILDFFIEQNVPEGYLNLGWITEKNPPPGAELIDMFLINDGTLEDLEKKVREQVIPAFFREI